MRNTVFLRHAVPVIAFLSLGATAAESTSPNTEAKSNFRSNPLVMQIRAATEQYKYVDVAVADGYVETACASGPNGGAMGVHFVKPPLIDGDFSIETPEVLIYEPQANGRMRLVGVEYIVIAELWDNAHADDGASPVANGQLFHFGGAPNRYRLPPFYELHVWAWKKNPNGTFADWNPRVTCDYYGTN